ncbi:hypothetical protein RBY4I_3996 [Rhodobacterales bacterium Y4I]|nr:hypothetical protein RBY4I_3996 [Rhodobacterales bacterium Y4I]
MENVHDPERIEAACFAEIDPSSSIVEDICLLSDEFTDHLRVLFSVRKTSSETLLPA